MELRQPLLSGTVNLHRFTARLGVLPVIELVLVWLLQPGQKQPHPAFQLLTAPCFHNITEHELTCFQLLQGAPQTSLLTPGRTPSPSFVALTVSLQEDFEVS